jgi:hypothetical protein
VVVSETSSDSSSDDSVVVPTEVKVEEKSDPEEVAVLTDGQKEMLAAMEDNSNIEMRMRIRKMSHVERASPDH